MHKDILLITTYNRPDYLRLCLEYLSRAEGVADKEIRIYVDRGKSLIREFYEVVNDFSNLRITTNFRETHSYHGNSYSTLEAYKYAYHSDARFVYLVEDDVLVMPDFFKWHEAAQARGNFMCSVAYRCRRNAATRKDITDPAAYLVSGCDYASIGVCWKRENLAPVIAHACDEYYKDLNGYLNKHFPNSRFSDCFTEQDGLVMRVLGESNGLTIWPYVCRAFHIGFSGYNRPRGTRLSYQELKETIHNEEKIKAADRDFGDIETVPTDDVPAWKDLHCVQIFD